MSYCDLGKLKRGKISALWEELRDILQVLKDGLTRSGDDFSINIFSVIVSDMFSSLVSRLTNFSAQRIRYLIVEIARHRHNYYGKSFFFRSSRLSRLLASS